MAPSQLPIHAQSGSTHHAKVNAEHEGPSGEGVLWGIQGLLTLLNGAHTAAKKQCLWGVQGEQPSALHTYGIRTFPGAAQLLIWCYV